MWDRILAICYLLARAYVWKLPFSENLSGQPTFFVRWLLFYQKERCYGSEFFCVGTNDHYKVTYGKKSVTRPPLHIALCYNLGWNGSFSNFFSFRATEGLFVSKWGRISPDSDWCLNLFCGHLQYFSGGLGTFPSLSVTWASAPIAERVIRHLLSILV